MRLLRLDLRNYGPFRNAPPLDLGGGGRGLHLIVGPNEAGKSSALRAIRALLFDYPRTTPDDHGRDPAGLRVGGALRNEAGAEVAFVRRKRGSRFWTPDDRSSLPGDPLPGVLDGLDQATFEELFSTDHAELVAGGRAILAGGGKLGAMLFAAGSGLAHLEAVQASIRARMDELFKGKNARIPAINKGLDDLKVAREEVRREALPTGDWVAAQEELTRLVDRRAEVDRQRHARRAELERTRGWLVALRIVPRRRDVADRLAARGPTRDLRPGFADAYRAEAEADRSARRTVVAARLALAAADAQLAALGPADPILDHAAAVQRLHADLGRYSEARADRPGRLALLDRLDEGVRTLRVELPEAATIPPAGLGALRDPIQALAVERATLQARRDEAEAELARLDAVAADQPDEPGPADTAVADLDAAIARAVAPGDLEAASREARAKRSVAEAEAARSLRGLALWAGTLDELESLAIPPEATFDRAAEETRAADERIRLAEAERIALGKKRIKLDRDGERARIAGSVPTASDLDDHRRRRDDLWRDLRRSVEAGTPPLASRLDDYEAAWRDADALADRLRHEADRVAADAQREVERRDLDEQITLGGTARDRAEADRAAALDRWAAHWRPLGIEPLSPREMRDWVRVDRPERLRAARAAREADAEVARLDDRLDALRADLGHALARVAEPPVAPGESLAGALDRARGIVARLGARVQLAAVRARLVDLDRGRADWLDRWRLALESIGLTPDASPTTANLVVDRLGAWADAAREARAARDHLADLDHIAERFVAEAGSLLDRLDPPSPRDDQERQKVDAPRAPGPPDWADRTEALMTRLAEARRAQTQRTGFRKRLDEEHKKLNEAERALALAGDALAGLANEAGCEAVAALPEAIARAEAVAADRAELRRLDEQLDAAAGTQTRAELLGAVADRDEASLAAEVAAATDAVAALEADLATLGEGIGATRLRLDQMDVCQGAHGAEQQLQDVVARLGGDVEQYARLRLASAVLRDAIERHRLRSQGPILDRAGDLFRRLTAGSFVGLQPDRDDKGQDILRAVRNPGPTAPATPEGADPAPTVLLDVAQMSEGTADQLYLALRLASLAVHLDDHPPAPFVVDDILVNFDDDRARAALEALAELSRRTQVLFFTHHDHLARIAEGCVPTEDLFLHRLDPRPAPGRGADPDPTRAELPPAEPTTATPPGRRSRSTASGGADRA